MSVSVENFAFTCRFCIRCAIDDSQNALKLFTLHKNTQIGALSLAEIFTATTPWLEISETDNLPQVICNYCLDKLLAVQKFQRMCVQSDKVLRQCLLGTSEVLVKKELHIDEDAEWSEMNEELDYQTKYSVSCLDAANFEMLEENTIKSKSTKNVNCYKVNNTEEGRNSMEHLLEEFGLEHLLPQLAETGIKYRHLKYLNEGDIADAIKKIGDRAEFRTKLFNWRKSSPSEEIMRTNNEKCIFNGKTLNELLSQSDTGALIKSFYKKHNCLTDNKREKIVNIILESIFVNDKQLTPNDFKSILGEILELFPEEKKVSDFYYIPREGKRAPSGRLFSKYKNTKHNRKRKLCENISIESSISENVKQIREPSPEIPDNVADIKSQLNLKLDDWASTCDRWSRSYQLRQKDLKTLDSFTFLAEWPLLKHPRTSDLVNIDFEIKYPGKGEKLFDKWNAFRDVLIAYCNTKNLNASCKQMLKIVQESENIDKKNYISMQLLNSVLPPKGIGGKFYSILDAQQFFVVTTENVNNICTKIEELEKKCASLKTTLQPIVIAEYGLHSEMQYYVYFDKVLLKFGSFLNAFDCTFKLFQILNLKYPEPCVWAWTFVQIFLYEVNTPTDARSASLTLCLNYFADKI